MSDPRADLLRTLASFGSDVTDATGGASENAYAAALLPLLHFVGFAVVTAAALRHVGRHRGRLRIAHDGAEAAAAGEGDGGKLVYHESARSIVFREHLSEQHQAAAAFGTQTCEDSSTQGGQQRAGAVIPGFTPVIRPFPALDLDSTDVFQPLLDQVRQGDMDEVEMSRRENAVVSLLREERAVVKTIRNADWVRFVERLDSGVPFRTATSLLPSLGKRMRCYGSPAQYKVGVVFALPHFDSPGAEDAAVDAADTWCWPSGYSAKTEYNVDRHGKLTHGRKEALVTVSTLRKYNHAYLHDDAYVIAGHICHRGEASAVVPYNEMHVQVGGDADGGGTDACAKCTVDVSDHHHSHPFNCSYEHGIGVPVALFVRTASFSDLMFILRTRAHIGATMGKDRFADMPLLFITPESGVTLLAQKLQTKLLRCFAGQVNPFQNSTLYHQQPTSVTEIDSFDESHLRQKVRELLDLNDEVFFGLTLKEKAKIAGGFGITDDSVHHLFLDALQKDCLYKKQRGEEEGRDENEADEKYSRGQELDRCLNAALVWSVRAADYHTARQLLILYTFVASRDYQCIRDDEAHLKCKEGASDGHTISLPSCGKRSVMLTGSSLDITAISDTSTFPFDSTAHSFLSSHVNGNSSSSMIDTRSPLDIDRLRSATNSDSLLAVLGAAEILKSMQGGGAKRRLEEAVSSIEEWIANGEQSIFYRLSSWKDQRAAQHDLNIAAEHKTNLTAFIGYHAIANRQKFASRLRDAIKMIELGQSAKFLQSMRNTVLEMNRPSLRLELLQFVFDLDNRYSVAHIASCCTLAATCIIYHDTHS